ncbi:spermatogenesis associated 2-like [Chiloscyllium plagiosum]|uniref:spermatogenesis associated 2-like n=1 Tax=Chiloscyllium plagiosum TaxID=36176 RepID=UPI001CB87C7E|nr:spermatogenesis associated 2-like [Chiloscyllium plagiosum]XP_043562614.1 spermatogenesis associated 2-like [Chiloscyllium plagiosum]
MSTGFRIIFDQYKKLYEDGPSGQNITCQDAELKGLVKQKLIERAADLALFLQDDMVEIISKSLHKTMNYTSTLKLLIRAFELLELAAVNLFLYPWRNEFKTIKMFSGAYVHYLKPAICNEDLIRFFKKMGYTLKDNLQLEIKDLPYSLELIRLAFEFFVMRIECEILLEIVIKLDHYQVSVDELLQERKLMENIDICVSKLKRLRATDRNLRENLLKKTPSAEDSVGKDLGISSIRNQAGSHSQRDYDGNAIHSPTCKSVWPTPECQCKDGDGDYNKHFTGIPDTNCVPSMNQHQAKDRYQFNSISNLQTVRDKKMVLLENIDAKNYKQHCCLSNGESVHFCCTTCLSLHTIMCEAVKKCTSHGHSLTFFGAQSSTCLPEAEASNSDLKQLSCADMAKSDTNCGICSCESVRFLCKCGMRVCFHCAYKNILICEICGNSISNSIS